MALLSDTYYYRVRAISASGPSAYSNEASIEIVSLDPDVLALLAEAALQGDQPVSGNVLIALNTLVVGLKALDNAGVSAWDSYDYLLILWTNGDRNFALYDVKSATQLATESDNPVFSPYRGFRNLDDISFINLGWNPADNGVQYTQNNASITLYLNTAGITYDEFAPVGFRFGTRSAIFAPNRDTITGFQATINSNIGLAGNWTIPDNDRLQKGFYLLSRFDANAENFYTTDGAFSGNKVQNSNSLFSFPWYIGGYNNGGALIPSRSSIAVVGMGRAMDGIAPQLATLYDAYIAASNNQEVNVVDLDLNIVFDGDSRIRGFAGTPDGNENVAAALERNHLSVPNNVRSYDINSFGVNGQTIAQMDGDAPVQIDPLIDNTKTNVLIYLEGVNSIVNNGQTAALTYSQHNDYINNRNAAGWDVIVFISEAEPRVVGGAYNSPNFTPATLQQLRDFDQLFVSTPNPNLSNLVRLRLEPIGTIGGDVPATEVNAFWNDSVHYLESGYAEIAQVLWDDVISNL